MKIKKEYHSLIVFLFLFLLLGCNEVDNKHDLIILKKMTREENIDSVTYFYFQNISTSTLLFNKDDIDCYSHIRRKLTTNNKLTSLITLIYKDSLDWKKCNGCYDEKMTRIGIYNIQIKEWMYFDLDYNMSFKGQAYKYTAKLKPFVLYTNKLRIIDSNVIKNLSILEKSNDIDKKCNVN